jgi:hypothetical protein
MEAHIRVPLLFLGRRETAPDSPPAYSPIRPQSGQPRFPQFGPDGSAIDFQLSAGRCLAHTCNHLPYFRAPRSSPRPLDRFLYSYRRRDSREPHVYPRQTNKRRTKNHDRCAERSVIFDPNICHGLNGINMLSHTYTHPPKSQLAAIKQLAASPRLLIPVHDPAVMTTNDQRPC